MAEELSGGALIIKAARKIEETTSGYDREKLQERLARLSGSGVALLNATETLKGWNIGGDAATGVMILCRALEEPLRAMAQKQWARWRDGAGQRPA